MVVLIDQPLRVALGKPDAMGQMAKWTLELIEFDIVFQPWPSIRSQVLVNFATKCTILDEESRKVDTLVEEPLKSRWVLHVDGSSNANGSGAGLILVSPKGGII